MRLAFALALAAATGGCGALDFFEGEEPRLPGERVAVRRAAPQAVAATAPSRAIALPAPAANADWAQPGGNAGRNAGHVAASPSPAIVWRGSVGGGDGGAAKIVSPPVIAGGRVYALDAGATVSALDASSGARVWSTDLTPENEGTADGFGGGVAVEGGRVFVSNGFGNLHALDAGTGAVAWTAPLGAPSRAAPVVAGGRVFAVTRDNRVVAVDAASGEEAWREQGLEQTAGILGGAAPAATDRIVVAPFSSGELAAFEAPTGRLGWVEDLTGSRGGTGVGIIADVAGDPVIADGVAYAASQSGRLAAVDLRRGERVWTRDLGGLNAPAVAGDAVFFVTARGDLYALDRETGETVWVRPLGAFRDPDDREDPILWSGPLVAGGNLWLTSNWGELVGVSAARGEVAARVALPDGSRVPPVAANGTIYVLTTDAEVVALR